MMVRVLTIALALLCIASLARAEGFKIGDLRDVTADVSGYVGGGTFGFKATEAKRLTVFCEGCDGLVAIDIRLGRSTDGTEERYRSGETSIEKMASLCKANNPSCELEAVALGKAVGWVTRYAIGPSAGSTAVLFLDGDQLIVRSIANDVDTAAANGTRALRTIGKTIIGEE